jgi:predicted ABC-type ATPase
MSGENDVLSQEEHARIFRERVLRQSMFDIATSQERPRAIILAGQPGSGKGGLAATAVNELGDDAVTVDPDELRRFHPKVGDFRRETPYTWSGRTHADASQWADELLDETVAGRKNLIFDTTLSNGQWASELINDLKAKGYDVEVRAIATSKIESELGVDRRFTQRLDVEGFGRHVPEGARDAIYGKLPTSLDTVHANTDVPIRIFNREGVELYDSRTDLRAPGAALEAARDARLRNPEITHALRDQWMEQQRWHRDLPEALPNNGKVDPQTRENLLAQRRELHVADSVDRLAREATDVDHLTRVQPARMQAGRALGVAGLALEAYDGADSIRTANRLSREGNQTAAESELTHFGARSVGGWAGAGIGMAGGALLGVETGPGLLVTGAIGGVAGVFAGDKFAEWTDNRRIYNQELGGNTWTYDPDNPALGWRREAPIDRTDDNIDNARRGDLRASPATENQLNYQATSVSVELVLGGPPPQRDPFSLPAEAGDTSSSRSTNWERNAETGAWRREVYGPFVERGMTPHHTETADAERSARLDRQAAAIVVENAANSPASIAARYEDTYLRNGWQAHGEMPDAVRNARTNIDTLVASDGDLYQRQANGRWVSDGMILDSTASGRLHDELEATRTVLEARLPPPRDIPPAPLMDADARLRDTLAGAYRNAGVEANDAQIATAATAVRATWQANGLDPSTTALQVKPQADGRYGIDSPIASLRLDADGKTYVIAAETTPADIARAQSNMRSPPQPVERAPEQERDAPTRDQASARAPQGEQIAIASTAPRLPDPRTPGHPDHRLYTQIEHGVAGIDAERGRSFDATSERLAMGAFHDAKAAGITSADHVAINRTGKPQPDGTQIAGGTLLFVVQGQDVSDPAARRAMTDIAQAVGRPIEDSLQRVDDLAQQQARILTQASSQPMQDEANRTPRMV